MERLFWEPSLHLCSVYSPAFSVNNHCYIYVENRQRNTEANHGCVMVQVHKYLIFLTSGVFFLNSRLRSISFFLVCSLSSCLLASCVAVASSSFCNTNKFLLVKKIAAHVIILKKDMLSLLSFFRMISKEESGAVI